MVLVYGTEEWESAYQEILQRRLSEKSEPYVRGTPEWVYAYEKLVQEDAVYKEAAKGWEGTVTLHTLAEPDIGMEEDGYMLMDLWHGDCRSMRIVGPEAGEASDYVLTGSYLIWKRISIGEQDTNKALMQGRLKLKGDLPKLARYTQASTRLTDLSIQLGGRFFDELDPEETEEIKRMNEELKEKLL
jgi:putative sterol carrier protein